MKVSILTQNAPVFIPRYVSNITKNKDIEYQILFFPSFLSNCFAIKYNYNFYGFKAFMFLFLKILHIKFKETLQINQSINQNLQKKKIQFHYLKAMDNAKNKIEQFSPDILISLACPQKLPPEIILLPKYGSYNVHSALLPKYKGVNAIFWAMLNNEKEIGVTLHKMNEKLDEGDIIIQKKINIYENETYVSIANRVIQVGSDIINNFIINFNLFYGNGVKQEKIDSYFSYPQKKDRILFHTRGKRFFNKYV